VNPGDIGCSGPGINTTVINANYTCRPGYFATSAPLYCTGVKNSRTVRPLVAEHKILDIVHVSRCAARKTRTSRNLPPLAVCVPGVADPGDIVCAANGTNATVTDPTYTCTQGYFAVGAPTYCRRMGKCDSLPHGHNWP
jgi:hypothetical protein